jgi:hypothetical protein
MGLLDFDIAVRVILPVASPFLLLGEARAYSDTAASDRVKAYVNIVSLIEVRLVLGP